MVNFTISKYHIFGNFTISKNYILLFGSRIGQRTKIKTVQICMTISLPLPKPFKTSACSALIRTLQYMLEYDTMYVRKNSNHNQLRLIELTLDEFSQKRILCFLIDMKCKHYLNINESERDLSERELIS